MVQEATIHVQEGAKLVQEAMMQGPRSNNTGSRRSKAVLGGNAAAIQVQEGVKLAQEAIMQVKAAAMQVKDKGVIFIFR